MKVKLTTGLGYIKNADGYIVAKFDLPIREHKFKDIFTVVEVANRDELKAIKVNVPKSPEEIKEMKIRQEINAMMREQAIERLTARGEL